MSRGASMYFIVRNIKCLVKGSCALFMWLPFLALVTCSRQSHSHVPSLSYWGHTSWRTPEQTAQP